LQTEAKGQGESEMNTNQNVMRAVLTDTFGQPGSGKLDLNNTSVEELANRLRDPLARAGVAMSEQQLQTLASGILGEINYPSFRFDRKFRRFAFRSGNELWYYEHSSAGVLPGAVPRSLRTDGGTQSGCEAAPEGLVRHLVRLGRHAGVHRVPLRVDLRFGRGNRVLPRHADHHRVVFSFRIGRFP
jgi:hypothetical protein